MLLMPVTSWSFLTSVPTVSAEQVGPILVTGNPSCATLNASTDPVFAGITSDFGYKLNQPLSNFVGGPFPLTQPPGELTGGAPQDPNNSVSVALPGVPDPNGPSFNWTSTLGMDAVIVKGGPNADAYVYTPEAFFGNGLHAPTNPDNGQYFGISHIEFCYDYEVSVSKTANTTYTRTYNWTIQKTVSHPQLQLAKGQTFDVNYSVSVGASFVDSDFAVNGTITIANNTPLNATLQSVSDVISKPLESDINATVDCAGITFPYNLAAGASVNCTYSSALPDKSSRLNTATVTTSGAVGGNTGQAAVTFGAPTSQVDECIDISDTLQGALGTVCFSGAGTTFSTTITYTRTIGPFQECGTFDVMNIASFETNDTGATGSDDANVHVVIDCDQPDPGSGCTLTQGYWKNHAGPAGLNPANADVVSQWLPITLGIGPKSITVTTVQQAVKMLDFDQKGWYLGKGDNGINKLLGQMLAAKLNIAAGANPAAISSALTAADTWIGTNAAHMPTAADGWGGWKQINGPNKNLVLGWKDSFDKFNMGVIGPGKCTQ
jgi:hypothetical protein